MSSTRKKPQRFRDMTTQELIALAGDTSELDEEFVADTFQAPSKEERKNWKRAKRPPGRPRRGKGAHVVSVSVERDLLARADALARKMGLTRSILIARGLKAMLAAADQ